VNDDDDGDDAIVWFVDRSLGKGVARALVAAGESAIHHDEILPQEAGDAEWLPVCAANGWVVLTKDKAIRRRMNERDAHVAAGGRAFFLTSGTMSGAEMAACFAGQLEALQQLVASTPAPFLALVSRSTVTLHQEPSRRRRR
jgi:predicted nuclease of predicted toxin-antitoxin system